MIQVGQLRAWKRSDPKGLDALKVYEIVRTPSGERLVKMEYLRDGFKISTCATTVEEDSFIVAEAPDEPYEGQRRRWNSGVRAEFVVGAASPGHFIEGITGRYSDDFIKEHSVPADSDVPDELIINGRRFVYTPE